VNSGWGGGAGVGGSIYDAEQALLKPPPEPKHSQSQGPVPLIADGFPAEQRFVGVIERTFPLSEPQAPVIPAGVVGVVAGIETGVIGAVATVNPLLPKKFSKAID